jgi:hypothetical protein
MRVNEFDTGKRPKLKKVRPRCSRLIIRAVVASLSASLVVCLQARAETDPFLVAVGFALTGTDNAKVKVLDKKTCAFQIGNQIFRLNNVQVDRLHFQNMVQKYLGTTTAFVRVSLHGAATVYEEFKGPQYRENSSDPPNLQEFYRLMKPTNPELFKPQHIVSNENTLDLYTNESDRLRRAWSYIYENGCTGATSPF